MAIETKYSDRHHAQIHECPECGAWTYAERAKFGTIKHRRSCDSQEQYRSPVARDGAQAMQAAAKAGTLNRDYSEDEIVDGVAVGLISVSDAMNQDM